MATREQIITRVLKTLAVTADHTPAVEEAVDGAIEYLVRNYDFMRSQRLVEIPVLANSRLVQIPLDVRKIRFAQTRDASGYRRPLHGGQADTFPVYPDGWPYRYWRDNVNQLWLETPMPTDATIELYYFSKTGTGDSGQTAAIWMPAEYEDLIKYRAIVVAAPIVRKPELVGVYLPLWQEAVSNLTVEQHENEYSNTSEKMEFQPGPRGGAA